MALSYAKCYRVQSGPFTAVDTSLVETGNGYRHLVISAVDGDDQVTVSMTGPRGGKLGSFKIYRQTLRDLVAALETEGLTDARNGSR